jgi:erythromycin esterase-like protein
MLDDDLLARAIGESAHPLRGAADDLDPLVERCAGARLVLIGEATHGSHEFYRIRAELTRRLIREEGFTAVAAEADWPDSHRVDRYVRGRGDDRDALAALGDFARFPAWMWRNTDVLDFVGWLRAHNDAQDDARGAVGFYGLDLYSLHASIDRVLGYLDRVDPAAARRARARYACFEHAGEDPQAYGYAAGFGLSADCEREAVSQLVELQRQRAALLARDGLTAEDDQFAAEQNARVVKNAEEYYRAMFRGRISSWNLRDSHMADTLDAVLGHLDGQTPGARAVVWAHNSHVGDARATELGAAGELDLGQLARQRHPGQVVLIGFTTYRGTVTAATDWGAPAERKRVRDALPGSYEALLHRVGLPRFILRFDQLGEAAGALRQPRLERAIGVVYRPQSERASHYFECRLPDQFDAVLHLDETSALQPLERAAGWERGEAPETFPTGL